MILIWLGGLARRRIGRLLGAIAGVALAVALLADLGAFLASSSASMTAKAVASVPVDWQVQLVNGADAEAAGAAIGKAAAYDKRQAVGYADVAGFEARSGGTVQTTGPGKAIGLDPSYRRDFPGQLRALLGPLDGVLLAQQTAANLHVTIGDHVTIQRMGQAPIEVAVDGIVDLPNADSLFQAVGLPAGAAPQAPPDNVILLPLARWHELFDPQANVRPDSVKVQLHIGLRHDLLPGNPAAAFAQVANAGRNLEARIAGSGLLANNLAARLDAVRADALYAQVLFLFLGTPGALLAVLLTIAVAASGAAQRRRDQALLRTRGATSAGILLLAASETLAVAGFGIAFGLLIADLLSAIVLHASFFDRGMWIWLCAAAVLGLIATSVAVLVPAWMGLGNLTVAQAGAAIAPSPTPLWQRAYLDILLLALAAVLFWRSQNAGYQLVLAPEGVPQSSVDYHAFLAPLLLWIGIALFTIRLLRLALGRGRGFLATALRLVAGALSGIVAVSLSRQKNRLTHGVVLLLVAISFATSTAVFDTTYNAQSLVDAELTNGADVTVTGRPGAPASDLMARLRALPGVAAAQAMQHRFAYVGTDLQDLYGVDAAHIGEATSMSDAYFQGGDAKATLRTLAGTPDGLLVSEETVRDFQLQRGDRINLRLQSLSDHQYHVVPFRFIGVVREFPTAPRDSFLVANAAYVAGQTGSNAAEIVLLRAMGEPSALAAAAREASASLPGAKVTDVGASLRLIQSSLTAIDLAGLTRLELVFAILMAAGSAGIVFALNLADRRRALVLLSALGATQRQIGAFIWSEALIILVAGLILGLATGAAVAQILVMMLTGVFDPPPQSLAIPWGYLLLLVACAILASVAAVLITRAAAGRSLIEGLKTL
jgi:putative ABC transport system permease protein